ncbi:MAG: helix-turn-helix domain-containing protein [Ardenticatenales bacterium]
MTRRHYSDEERAAALVRVAGGETPAAVARALDIPVTSLRRWVKAKDRTPDRTPEKAPATSPPTREPRPWYGPFLIELARTCNVTHAVTKAGIERSTAYEARADDEAFAEMWAKAKQIGAEVLEDEAVRRAHEGWDEPAIYQGKIGACVRKFSDSLLIFLLKGAMPEKYRERHDSKVEQNGTMTVIVRREDRPIRGGNR